MFRPDGIGDVERSWTVLSGAVLALTGDDGGRLPLGNDWGIQVQQACVATLGQAAEWQPGEFALRWDGDSVRAGLGIPPDRVTIASAVLPGIGRRLHRAVAPAGADLVSHSSRRVCS